MGAGGPRRTRRAILFGILAIAVAAAIIRMTLDGYWQDWTGFGEYQSPAGEFQRSKTLWDWLDLLLLPFAISGAGLLIALRSRRSNRDVGRKTPTLEAPQAIERANPEVTFPNERSRVTSAGASPLVAPGLTAIDERLREQTLQAYMDRMSGLLLDRGLNETDPGDAVRRLARAITLASLMVLDGRRKGMLLQFLYEADLISQSDPAQDLMIQADLVDVGGPVLDLRKADLRGAILAEKDLSGSHLQEVDLSGADLHFSILNNANLRGARLAEANLSEAQLIGASLRGAYLPDANLSGSDLTGAILRGAELMEANLEGADLTNSDMTAAVLTTLQLKRVRSLAGATLRDGTKYDLKTQGSSQPEPVS